jgi:hypothetical protein
MSFIHASFIHTLRSELRQSLRLPHDLQKRAAELARNPAESTPCNYRESLAQGRR